MKSYLLVLLSALGLSFLISSYAPEINQDILTTPIVNQEQSLELLSEKTPTDEKEIASLSKTKAVSTSIKTTSSKTTSAISQGYTITKVTDDLIAMPSYRDIYRTGRLVYAHNTDDLFGHLKSLRKGSSITLTENGVTTTYTVSDIGYFSKVPYTNPQGQTGENLAKCDASYNNCSGIFMGTLVSNAMGHKLALMTCDGGSGTLRRLMIFVD